MPQDLHELPRFEDGWSYLYLEHCKIEQDSKSIACFDAEGKISVPCSILSLLLLGPGSSISHEAVKTLVDNGCSIGWCGEGIVRFYASGMGETRSSLRLLKQAKLVSDPNLHLKVSQNMYRLRFGDTFSKEYSLAQLRGMEGQRVKKAYADASKKTGIEWAGRNYNPHSWNISDPVNRALSIANSCLYGICHAAIVSLGYSPGLGFIHTGKQLSFVYDIADLYKAEITIPLAFDAVSKSSDNLEKTIRYLCRDYFNDNKLLPRIVKDIETVMSVDIHDNITYPDFDNSVTVPGDIWDDQKGSVSGGINYYCPD